MPELPDITIYLEALRARVQGQTLERVRVVSPFLLRTFDPPIDEAEGKRVIGLRRLGKRIVLELEGDLFLVIHLMIAGRFIWKPREATPVKVPAKVGLAAFDFTSGTLILTEASSKKRASLHLMRGEAALLAEHQRSGLEVLDADPPSFRAALLSENHTVKRSLTDPHLFSGIGNAYSDEILHAAKLSPIKLTQKLTDEEIARLFAATQSTLQHWIDRTRQEVGDGFPEPRRVTAFREGMAVHGRFGKPCPVCGAKVQRIIYAENETNYCPKCQTEGKLLKDRSLSRLLKDDWPKMAE